MRILHLGPNVASQMSVTVRALRAAGEEALGIALPGNAFRDPDWIRTLPPAPRNRPLHWALARAEGLGRVLPAVAAADIIHWHFAAPSLPGNADLRLARRLHHSGIVEFHGSELRAAEILSPTNPFYANSGPGYEYRDIETGEASSARQRTFSRAGVRTCLVRHSQDRYLVSGLWDRVTPIMGRIWIDDYQPELRPESRGRPVVVHAPTAPIAKGTPAVLRAVQTCKDRGLDFSFVLLKNVDRKAALEALRSSDIVLDQFVVGDGYGMTAVEAMAFGKPVLGYLDPQARKALPHDLPLVQATQDDLPDVLEQLLASPRERQTLGDQSRSFAETHHDARLIAGDLVGIYGSVTS